MILNVFKIKSCVQVIGVHGEQCIKDMLDFFDIKRRIGIKKFGAKLFIKDLGVYVFTQQGYKFGQRF